MSMDVNDVRILITAVSFVIFLGIVFWAFSGKQRRRFDEAAQLPFAEPDTPVLPIVAPAPIIDVQQTWPGGKSK